MTLTCEGRKKCEHIWSEGSSCFRYCQLCGAENLNFPKWTIEEKPKLPEKILYEPAFIENSIECLTGRVNSLISCVSWLMKERE